MHPRFLAVAFTVAALFLTTASYAEPAPDNANHGCVYIGHIEPSGAWETAHFDRVPTMAYAERADVKLPSPVVIEVRRDANLHSALRLSSEIVGTLSHGAEVKMLGYHQTFGHVWADVDTSGAKVHKPDAHVGVHSGDGDQAPGIFFGEIDTYARDGFTGRSGTSTNDGAFIMERIDDSCTLAKGKKPKAPSGSSASPKPEGLNPKGLFEDATASLHEVTPVPSADIFISI